MLEYEDWCCDAPSVKPRPHWRLRLKRRKFVAGNGDYSLCSRRQIVAVSGDYSRRERWL